MARVGEKAESVAVEKTAEVKRSIGQDLADLRDSLIKDTKAELST